ncbi:hypothetical protein [Lawsonibacter celer]|uniref:hypothetical protein n=1 Tax=Lawsonibacter celer TaxID=2986526 RepID=UPI0016466FC1|nr:hypothetical protein [Lawsonibacter celer]
MRAWLECYDGRTLSMPDLLEWRMEYTSGTPCDSFFLSCIWEPDRAEELADAVRFGAEQDGERVFSGVVDEIECGWDGSGGRLELSGRGMAALLLDNEALGCDYQVATLADILRDHVTPYGIRTAGTAALPAVPGFSVAAGSSEWQVLYQFARYYGGVEPRFDRQGRLVLEPWRDTARRIIDGSTAVSSLAWRYRRYGVLSQVLVRDRTRQTVQPVVNEEFDRRGGQCRRVLTMPGRSSYQAMRYSGAYQLEQSAAERSRLELELPGLFCAWPGELAEVRLERAPHGGLWRVSQTRTGVDSRGEYTRLILNEE